MATSGTTTFDLSVDELIIEAYERNAVTSPTGLQLRSARRSLNLLLADLNNRDLHLFKRVQTTFNTVASTTSYTLANSILDVYKVNYFAYNRIEDVGDYTNTIDVPVKFLPAVTTGLAFMLSEKLPTLDTARTALFKARYDEEVLRVIQEDEERTSLYLTPNLAGTGFETRGG